MWKFLKNLMKKIFKKKRKAIQFMYDGRKVKAVAIGNDVTMKIEQPLGRNALTADDMDEILKELTRRLK